MFSISVECIIWAAVCYNVLSACLAQVIELAFYRLISIEMASSATQLLLQRTSLIALQLMMMRLDKMFTYLIEAIISLRAFSPPSKRTRKKNTNENTNRLTMENN